MENVPFASTPKSCFGDANQHHLYICMLRKFEIQKYVPQLNGTQSLDPVESITRQSCVAVCCSVLQCVAACCSVLQYCACVAVCCSALQYIYDTHAVSKISETQFIASKYMKSSRVHNV